MTRSRSLLLLLLLVSAGAGCVRRRLMVRSDPPGALVQIDGQEIGHTPVATPFTYYGTRKFRLVKEGYETVTVNQKFSAPWYQIPIVDFFSENLWPREIRDERIVDFELTPQANVSMNEILSQADQLRSAAQPTASASVVDAYASPGLPPASQGPWGSGRIPSR